MRVGILGGTGFVGRNLVNYLNDEKVRNFSVGKADVDATDCGQIKRWIGKNKITHVVNLAAACGGIGLNQKIPASLWYATQLISANVLEACRQCNIEKLVQVGSVCCYAKDCPVPFSEDDLMCHGLPEPTNRAYGIAKLNAIFGAFAYAEQYGLKVAGLIPSNMYGPYDHFDLENSHVIPALIRKIHDAKRTGEEVVIWGDGNATREFLYVVDFCRAVLLALTAATRNVPINIGTGSEISIKSLFSLLATIMEYGGAPRWDSDKPNGQPRRSIDYARATTLLGWRPTTELVDGLIETVRWFESHLPSNT